MGQDEDYELGVLLELREREADEARETYGAEVAELERRKKYVAARREELAEAVARREEACAAFDARTASGEATMGELMSFESYKRGLVHDETRLEEAIERAVRAVREQARRTERAKSDLVDATRNLKAVEKHREAWLEERAVEQRRKESARMDDIAARRWRENNS